MKWKGNAPGLPDPVFWAIVIALLACAIAYVVINFIALINTGRPLDPGF